MTSSIGRVPVHQMAFDMPQSEVKTYARTPVKVPVIYPTAATVRMPEGSPAKRLFERTGPLQPALQPTIAPKTTVPQTTTAAMPVNLSCNTHACASSTSPTGTMQAMAATQPTSTPPAPRPKETGFPWWLLLVGVGVAFSLSRSEKEGKGNLSGVATGKQPVRSQHATGKQPVKEHPKKVLKMII